MPVMIEKKTCKCCGATGEGDPAGMVCGCSGFFCVSTKKCVQHCRAARAPEDNHSCASERGSYADTFRREYRVAVPRIFIGPRGKVRAARTRMKRKFHVKQ